MPAGVHTPAVEPPRKPPNRINEHGERQTREAILARAAAAGPGPSVPDPAIRIHVRRATPSHAPMIRDIAHAAWRATHAGLIDHDVIEQFLARAYAEERVALRIDRHSVFVAGAGSVAVEAFAECARHDDHVQLVAIYALPGARGRGLGSALLAAVVSAYAGKDLAADVLQGNDLAEPFYAARGFLPGESLVDELAGEPVHERRWWLRATAATRAAVMSTGH